MDVALAIETVFYTVPPGQGGSCDLPGSVISPNESETHETDTGMFDSERRASKKMGGDNSACISKRESVIHNLETRTIGKGMKDNIEAYSEVCHPHDLFTTAAVLLTRREKNSIG